MTNQSMTFENALQQFVDSLSINDWNLQGEAWDAVKTSIDSADESARAQMEEQLATAYRNANKAETDLSALSEAAGNLSAALKEVAAGGDTEQAYLALDSYKTAFASVGL